ncbi:uncharacterized protein [Fopius arisanus]|uniref:Uncharacterized protein isoform X1 n=1 Tax=Fopius arisanus TaxID=64838 RepID=A0A9R1T5W2_9HYME|nr:PREDICTED: uncharacterized protein LOC105266725 isoform X1 [Fopius arisanus]
MKTRKKSNSFFKAIALLMILVISLKPSSGQSSDEKYTRGNYQMTKTQTRAREVRGIRPGSLQTARDFGKRNDRLLELKDVFDRQLKRSVAISVNNNNVNCSIWELFCQISHSLASGAAEVPQSHAPIRTSSGEHRRPEEFHHQAVAPIPLNPLTSQSINV